jgi:hypothetical protein
MFLPFIALISQTATQGQIAGQSKIGSQVGSYTQSVTDPDGKVSMRTRAQRLIAPGKPDIWLVGAVHVGTRNYYTQVQNLLNAQDEVLYEGVKPTDSSVVAMKPEAGAPPSIYKILSDAIGLDFQLSDIDYSRSTWKNVDLSWQTITALNKEATKGKPDQLDMIKSAFEPKGQMVTALTGMLAKATPGTREAYKLMIVKLSAAGLGPALDPTTNEIVINARNRKVVDTISSVLAQPNAPKSIGVFYGALHLPSMEKSLATKFGYSEAESRWLTSATADPAKLDATGKQLIAAVDQMLKPKPAPGAAKVP